MKFILPVHAAEALTDEERLNLVMYAMTKGLPEERILSMLDVIVMTRLQRALEAQRGDQAAANAYAGSFLEKSSGLLQAAALYGQARVLDYVVKCAPSGVRLLEQRVSNVDENNATLAHYAASAGHCHVLRYIAERAPSGKQALMQRLSVTGMTPAHVAASNGQLEAVECLVELCGAKAALLTTDYQGRKPGDLAAQQNQVSVVEYIQSVLRRN